MYDEFRHHEFGSGVPSYITFTSVGHSIKCLSESTCTKNIFLRESQNNGTHYALFHEV